MSSAGRGRGGDGDGDLGGGGGSGEGPRIPLAEFSAPTHCSGQVCVEWRVMRRAGGYKELLRSPALPPRVNGSGIVQRGVQECSLVTGNVSFSKRVVFTQSYNTLKCQTVN